MATLSAAGTAAMGAGATALGMNPALIQALAALGGATASGVSGYLNAENTQQEEDRQYQLQQEQIALQQKQQATASSEFQQQASQNDPSSTIDQLSGLANLKKSLSNPTSYDVMSYLAG